MRDALAIYVDMKAITAKDRSLGGAAILYQFYQLIA